MVRLVLLFWGSRLFLLLSMHGLAIVPRLFGLGLLTSLSSAESIDMSSVSSWGITTLLRLVYNSSGLWTFG